MDCAVPSRQLVVVVLLLAGAAACGDAPTHASLSSGEAGLVDVAFDPAPDPAPEAVPDGSADGWLGDVEAGEDPAEADAPADAAADRTSEGYWSLEPTWVAVEPVCAVPAGATAVVEVHIYIMDICQYPGPVEVVTAGERDLMVRAWLWIQHGPRCDGVTGRQSRTVELSDLTEGAWTLRYPGLSGETVELPVVVEPPLPAGGDEPVEPGAACRWDSQCTLGTHCLPVLALGGCAEAELRCASACSLSDGYGDYHPSAPDCAAATSCQGGAWDALCEERPGDWYCENLEYESLLSCLPSTACGAERPCPPGMACLNGPDGPMCDWTVNLWVESGAPCETSASCGPGLDCVEQAPDERRCQIRCQTAQTRCPGGFSCDFESLQGLPWVCEAPGC